MKLGLVAGVAAPMIGISLAAVSPAFATMVAITGDNGWNLSPQGAQNVPIYVSNAQSFGGSNASLVFGTFDNAGVNGSDSPLWVRATASFTPITTGTVTISAEVLLPTASTPSFLWFGDNDEATGPRDSYATPVETGDSNGWELIQTVINLGATNAPYTTTLNGVTIDSGNDYFSASSTNPLEINNIQIIVGPGVNAAETGPFYFGDMSVVSSVSGTVWSDNFDEYIAVPEPASFSLLALGATALLARRRRRIVR